MSKSVSRELKKIYNAAALIDAEASLEEVTRNCDENDFTFSKSWQEKWTDIIKLLDFPWDDPQSDRDDDTSRRFTPGLHEVDGTMREASVDRVLWNFCFTSFTTLFSGGRLCCTLDSISTSRTFSFVS